MKGSPRWRIRLIWASGIGLAAIWVLFTRVVVPWIIEEAYHGRSLGVLNRMISGSSVHPLEPYVEQWLRLARSLTFVVATVGLVVCAALTFRSLLRTRREAVFASDPRRAGWPELWLRMRQLVPIAVFFGLVAGLGESWYIAGRAFFVHQVIPGFRWVSPDSIWMAPVANLAFYLGVAVVLILVCLLLERRRAYLAGVFVLVFLATLALQLMTNRVYALAAVVLALGLAYQIGRIASRDPGGFRSAARDSLVPLMVVWAVAAVTVRISQRSPSPQPATERVAATRGQPNVLLLILDTVRAASVSTYGYERQTTPNIDRLASRGIVFDHAIATAPWTLPSHAGIFTGRFNYELKTDWLVGLDGTYPTLAEELSASGYATGGFAANIVFCTGFYGLDRGFERYVAQPINASMTFSSAWILRNGLKELRFRFGYHQPLVRKRASTVNREFLGWLDEVGDRPFFAFLNYFDAHGPYLPPKPFNRLFWPDQPLYWLQDRVYDPAELAQLSAAYDGSIAYMDEQVALLLQALEQRGKLENTIVILTSDHGESFQEHGVMGHGQTVYLPELRVPLLVVLPASAYAGTRVEQPVSLRSIPATVMELVGRTGESPFPGFSLAERWRAAADTEIDSLRTGDYILSELIGKKSLVEGDFHYWRDRLGKEELYDFRTDPLETRNLIDAGAADLALRMRAELDRALTPGGDQEPGHAGAPVAPGRRAVRIDGRELVGGNPESADSVENLDDVASPARKVKRGA